MDPSGNRVTLNNHYVNYGWEYTWHCHILAHEEMDAMRPVAVAVPPRAPYGLSVTQINGVPTYRLTWTDNSLGQTHFTIQRSVNGQTWTPIAAIPSTTGPTAGTTKTYNDATGLPATTYYYRALATNIVGDTFDYSIANPGAVGFPTLTVNSTASNIASTSTPIGDLFAAVQGSNNNNIYQKTYVNSTSTWSSWAVLPNGATPATPAIAVVGAKEYSVVKGSDGLSMYFGAYNIVDHSFSGWTWLSGTSASAPTLTTDGNILALVVIGADNRVYYRIYDTATQTWNDWHVITPGVTSDKPTAALLGGQLYIVVRGTTLGSNVLWYGTVEVASGVFSGWNPLNGSTTSAPVLSSLHLSTGLCLVVRGDNNLLYLNRWNGATWVGWTQVPSASTPSSPAIAVYGDKLHMIVTGMDGSSLWYNTMNLTSNAVGTWTPLSGSSPSAPTLTR